MVNSLLEKNPDKNELHKAQMELIVKLTVLQWDRQRMASSGLLGIVSTSAKMEAAQK